MNYLQTLAYLDELGEIRMSFGLENTSMALEALGRPDKKISSIIVAGTNGKGSTCAFLNSILSQASLKVGLFTSPHLATPRERIVIGMQAITEEDFSSIATYVREVCDEKSVRLTYFEFLTVMAALYFHRRGTDICIFEVGLGGRLDSTNALERIGGILAHIDLDHMHILGDTKEKIALEKAAILQPGKPAVISSQEKSVMDTIEGYCEKRNIRLTVSGKNFQVHGTDQNFCYADQRFRLNDIHLGIRGLHQIQNAGCSIVMIQQIPSLASIDETTIAHGLQSARIEGRLERWKNESLPDIWVDIGHNPDAVAQLVKYFNHYDFGKKFNIVIGMLQDKDWKQVLGILQPIAHKTILTKPNSERAWDIEVDHEEIEKALEEALSYEQDILCVGSFYLVGEIRKRLRTIGYKPS